MCHRLLFAVLCQEQPSSLSPNKMLSEVPVTCELWSEDDESSGSALTVGVWERVAVGSQTWVKRLWWPPRKNSPFHVGILFHWPGVTGDTCTGTHLDS